MATRELTPEEAKAAGLNPNGPQEPVDQEALAEGAASAEKSLNLPPGYVKTVSPDSEEAAIANLNTKRGQEEGRSNAKIALLEKLLAAAQTGSLGFGDEMKGAADAAMGGDYRKSQQAAQKEAKAAQEKHPWSSVAGALPSAIVGAPATLGGRLLGAGAMGLAGGVGNSDATLSQAPGEVAKDALVGGGTALAVQGGGELMSKGGSLLSQYLKQKVAPRWAMKAAGLRGGIANAPQKLGLDTQADLDEMGRAVLDADLIPFAGSKEAVQDRALALQKMAGQTGGSQILKAEVSGVPFDAQRSAWKAAEPTITADAFTRAKSSKPAKDFVKALLEEGTDNPGSYEAARKVKTAAADNVNWSAQPKGSAKLFRKSIGAMGGDLIDQVGEAAGPEAAAALRNANQQYGVASDVLSLAKDAGGREMSNRSAGLINTLSGLGGAGLGAAAGASPGEAALLALIAGKGMDVATKRGPAAFARTLDKAAAPAVAGAARALPVAAMGSASLTSDEENRQKLARYLELLASE